MPLTLRPTELAPPVYEDIADYEVLDDGESIGRIYEIRAPMRPDAKWFWSITVIGAYRAGVDTDGRTPSFNEAKAQFRANYERWRVWIRS
jgi:hypothetical protein